MHVFTKIAINYIGQIVARPDGAQRKCKFVVGHMDCRARADAPKKIIAFHRELEQSVGTPGGKRQSWASSTKFRSAKTHIVRRLRQAQETIVCCSHALRSHLVASDSDTGTRSAIPIAVALRQSLIELSAARQAHEGQQTKMEMVYQYLTGPRFRHRIEAIVEKFSDMQADLDKERKTMTRSWAKREAQIRGVIESTVGMYGDLQGIAGRALPEIDSIDTLSLDYSPKSESDD